MGGGGHRSPITGGGDTVFRVADAPLQIGEAIAQFAKAGVRGCRFFLIVGLMKGHVGGGPGFRWLQGVGGSEKARPFKCPNMHIPCIFVQERLLEMLVHASVIPPGCGLDINLRV